MSSAVESPQATQERPVTQPDPGGAKRDGWVLAAVTVSAACLLIALVAVALAFRYASDDDTPSGVAAPTEPVLEVDVELGDLFVTPAALELQPGQQAILTVTNNGAVPHDLKVGGQTGTSMLDPGASETITIGPFDGPTLAWCTVPGHRAAGMEMAIAVGGSVAPQDDLSTAAAAVIDANATPAPDWQPFDPALRPAPGGTEHVLTMRATETVMEVAPGVTQQVWTFDDQVPGPTLRGKVGDIFTITLVNDGQVGHSIDLHASKVAWNDEMRTIGSGESLVYQFEAKHSGIFMYHCGTDPTLHHIGNGMFGAIVIDPPDLAPVDQELILIQSELYLGPEGDPGDLDKMMAEDFDAVVFNGYYKQYLHQPIPAEVGERIRVWVLDAGPSENSAFHVVGTIFDTVYKEGTYGLRPDDGPGGAQVLDLQPAQGGFVEFTFDEAGLYPIVTHKFSNVGKGALGLFEAS